MIRKLTLPFIVLFASTLGFAGPHDRGLPPPPPAPPAPPAPPVPPSPPQPPFLQHGGGGGGGVTVHIDHDGKIQIDGIRDMIDRELDMAEQQLDQQGSNMPPQLREKLQRRLKKLRGKLDKRMSHLDARDVEHLGEELGQMGEEIGQEMEQLGSDMGDWGQKFGEEMAKKFSGKQFWHFTDPMHGKQPVDPYADNDNDNDNDHDVPSSPWDSEDVHVDVHDMGDFKLRPDQRERIRQLRDQARQEIDRAKEDLQRASDQLEQALDNDNLSEQQIDTAIDAVTQRENQIRKAKIHAWLRVRGALEQDQRQRIEAKVKHKSR